MRERNKVLVCDCGFVVCETDEDRFVAEAQRHATQVHGMDFSREQVLTLAAREAAKP